MQKKVAFKTLGCRLNQFETDALASEFDKNNYQIVQFNEPADVYIVNTCTVTNQSDHKSRNIISQAGRKNPDSVLVVTGCMANSSKEQLESREDVTYVVENTQKSSIYELVEAHYNKEIIHPSDFKKDVFNFPLAEKGFHTRSNIKIQDGCDNFCSFCIIPQVRGRAISRPVNDIMENIHQVLDLGRKEIVLTGVNIGRYDFEGLNFEGLLEKVLDIDKDFRVRISSIEPDGFGEKFYHLFENPKLCPHLHLCLQSGSDKVLMQMRRMYSLNEFRTITESIRKINPDFNFTTDVIVGFPGETGEDFQHTIDFINEVGFSHIHTFKYSKRKKTRAERMKEQIPEKIKSERSEIIRELSEKNRLKYRGQFVGKTQKVLIEKVEGEFARGYGQNYVPVKIKTDRPIERNTFVDVTPKELIAEGEPVLMG